MRRNCSLKPSQLCSVYAGLCIVTLLLAAGFWLLGAPAMLPFAAAEVLAVGLAMLVHARHVGDRDTLRLADGRLEVEQHRGAQIQRTTLRAECTQVEAPDRPGALIALVAQGRRTLVGRYLRSDQRVALARELRLAVHRQAAVPQSNPKPPR